MIAQNTKPTIGTYLYGWYDKNKWRGHSLKTTPLPGYYCSGEKALAKWQIDQLAHTGIDYVLFEMVPTADHSFSSIIQHIENALPFLREADIGYSFFIDFWVFITHLKPLEEYKKIIDFLDARGWLADIYANQSLGKAIFLFSPYPDLIESIRDLTPKKYEVYSSLWSPTWKTVTSKDYSPEIASLFERYWEPSRKTQTPLYDALMHLGFFPFWQETDQLISMNGIASVIPGYDDLLLNRNPQLAPVVPRNEGHTLVDQFKRAVETGAENILIYGWNEYFEATTIEPTLEYGDFYVELTRRLIEQAKRGEIIHFPDDMGKPERAGPIYLSPELERAAQRHHDKVPRWDQDDYVVVIDVPLPAVIEHGHAVFRKVRVTNAGLKPWRIKSECEPIRLGVRLLDSSGTVVREGRGELGVRDIYVGECVQVDLKVEVEDLSVEEKYRADIDLVWEEKFWFNNSPTSVQFLIKGDING